MISDIIYYIAIYIATQVYNIIHIIIIMCGHVIIRILQYDDNMLRAHNRH